MDDDLRSTSEGMNNTNPNPAFAPKPAPAPKKSHTKLYIAAGICAVLLLITAVVYRQTAKKDSAAPVSAPTETESTAPKPDVDSEVADKKDILESPVTEAYSSTVLGVSFKYPKTWKVSEATGGIRIESPMFNFTTTQNAESEGVFRIYIRQGARTVDGKYIGQGIAVKDSEKFTYTQPAVGQRTDTLLSSFGFNSSDIFSFFLIAGNFQLKKGDTLGPNYGKEPETYIITGGYAATAAVDDLGYSSVPLAYYTTSTAYKQGVAIVGSLQLK